MNPRRFAAPKPEWFTHQRTNLCHREHCAPTPLPSAATGLSHRRNCTNLHRISRLSWHASDEPQPTPCGLLPSLGRSRFDRLKALSSSKGSVHSVIHALIDFGVTFFG